MAARKSLRRSLEERVKELNCLYTISKLFDRKGITLDGIIRQTIEVVPTAWQYPEAAGAMVTLEGKRFKTGRFARSGWIQECPIIVRGMPVGTLAVSYREKRPRQDEGPFLKEERSLLNVIAQRLGDVIERKWSEREVLRYQEELRSLAAELASSEERERRRIAQALHDRIGQVLALINMRLGALMQAPPSKRSSGQLREIRQLVSECVAETRSLTFDLSPPILYELGFAAALEWLAEVIQKRYGVETALIGWEQSVTIGMEWRTTLFAAIRELLINVGKHAETQKAEVRLTRARGGIRIAVSDKGVGMNPARSMNLKTNGKRAADGFGLFSIRERLGFMGGRMELTSTPGKGTCITLFAPVNKGSNKRIDRRKEERIDREDPDRR